MKRATLEAVLRRKVRLKITKRKRGEHGFEVVLPGPFSARLSHAPVVKRCPSKREALVWLLVQLRCLEAITIEVRSAQAAPPGSPARPEFTAARTLMLSAPGRAGVLVESIGTTMREQPMPFADARAALSWCESERVTLIYTPAGPTPEKN